MSDSNIIGAWTDPVYRNSLSEREWAALPPNPAGGSEISYTDLGKVAGGREPAVVMRGPDGALYLIRDEVLELCRMNKKDAESAEMVLQNHQATYSAQQDAGSGDFTLETAVFQPIARRNGNFTPMALKLSTQSTIMCCWSSLCFED
jgi:mersacidin/lichenicidin family type 2 lantibiotic